MPEIRVFVSKIRIFLFLVFAASLLPLNAQQAQDKSSSETSSRNSTQATAPFREMPADMKAFTDASRIFDPEKKLEALEKFLTDYPSSVGVAFAHQTILELLVKNWPEKKDKIQAEVQKVLSSATGPTRSPLLTNVAAMLMDAGLTDQAEQLASQSLAAIDEEVRPRRGASLAILGRVWLKEGKTAEGEKALKEAYDADPSLADAASGLAELAEKAGNYSEAMEYLTAAALSGKMKLESRRKLESVYRQTHNNSLDGLEEMLDSKYRKLFPNPVRVEPYKPTPERTHRVVLAEVFSGAGCGPCVAADLAFEAALERYRRTEVAVVMYHLHIPRPDPLTNTSTEERAKFYGVFGVPAARIDGITDIGGGGTREMTRNSYDRITRALDKRLEAPARAQIRLEAASQASTVKVRATVNDVKGASGELRLQIALVEELVRYAGENGVRFHPVVVRDVAGPNTNGFPVDVSKPTAVDYTFDLQKISAQLKAHLDEYELSGRHGRITFSEKKYTIDPKHLSVVAFVQDDESKEVLQAVQSAVRQGR